ncbi:hypothetical protein NE236_20335 [Actinoallomurus purpureus]|uniref:hypothetical protein n=1 Tax=Actinoallomurus purpureus TaxID=478114 RepID=UPI0020923626|nr:hypothetical protein [Actinoallomurus purpureus]MCO6007332.1 hypothetical protein [Actinoallomurus purpureus]
MRNARSGRTGKRSVTVGNNDGVISTGDHTVMTSTGTGDTTGVIPTGERSVTVGNNRGVIDTGDHTVVTTRRGWFRRGDK